MPNFQMVENIHCFAQNEEINDFAFWNVVECLYITDLNGFSPIA